MSLEPVFTDAQSNAAYLARASSEYATEDAIKFLCYENMYGIILECYLDEETTRDVRMMLERKFACVTNMDRSEVLLGAIAMHEEVPEALTVVLQAVSVQTIEKTIEIMISDSTLSDYASAFDILPKAFCNDARVADYVLKQISKERE